MYTPERNSSPFMDIVEDDEIMSRPRPLRATIMTEVHIPPAPEALTMKRLEASTRFCFCDSRYEIQGIKQTAII